MFADDLYLRVCRIAKHVANRVEALAAVHALPVAFRGCVHLDERNACLRHRRGSWYWRGGRSRRGRCRSGVGVTARLASGLALLPAWRWGRVRCADSATLCRIQCVDVCASAYDRAAPVSGYCQRITGNCCRSDMRCNRKSTIIFPLPSSLGCTCLVPGFHPIPHHLNPIWIVDREVIGVPESIGDLTIKRH